MARGLLAEPDSECREIPPELLTKTPCPSFLVAKDRLMSTGL
jgi:hypothetical protein